MATINGGFFICSNYFDQDDTFNGGIVSAAVLVNSVPTVGFWWKSGQMKFGNTVVTAIANGNSGVTPTGMMELQTDRLVRKGGALR
jgi:hypothetical protein